MAVNRHSRPIFVTLAAALALCAGAADGVAADAVGANENVMGSPKAPVTMIEYFSQACTACAEFHTTVFPLLKAKYIDTGKVRYVMRLYPLFPVDGPAYKLDRCVPPARFFSAVDLLFRHQREWDNAEYPVKDPHAGLIRLAQNLGLSAGRAEDCMNSKKLDASINQQAAEAQAHYDPVDTPSFVINGVKDMNGVSWNDIQTTLDAAAKRGK